MQQKRYFRLKLIIDTASDQVANDNHISGAKMVQFCGHRLHVQASFQLFMTTTVPPSHLSPSLASEVSVVNFTSSLPLAEDLLVDIAFNMMTGKGNDFRDTSKGIAVCKAQLRSLNEELFDKLPMNGKEDCYWWSSEKITNIMSKKNEVQ